MNAYSIDQAAKVLKVSKPTIRAWMESGRLKSARLGTRSIRIMEDDLMAFFKAQYQDPKPKKEKAVQEDSRELTANEVAQAPEQPLEPVCEPPQEQPAEAPQEPVIVN